MHTQTNQNLQGSSQIPDQFSHGGHEVIETDGVIGGIVGGIEQYMLYEQHVQDPELKTMMNKHKAYFNQIYNSIVQAFQTGQEPTVKVQTYNFSQSSNNTIYGMQPSQPKTPAQSVNEINDACVAGFMMGLLKSNASALTMASIEATNPVVRRVLADSIPNVIEMAYELFLYENRKGYYQVPQLKQEDMQNYLNSYSVTQRQTH